MHKDPNLRKRNALVIPGGLLAILSLVGMGYVALLRGDAGTCEDGSLIVLAGACRSAVLILAIPLVIGFTMVAAGAIGFRNKATCRKGWGTGAHFGLAFLITLVLLPVLGILVAPQLVPDAVITRGGVDYPISSILAGLTLVGLVALVPYLGLYVARGRANQCCHEKGCFEPCFCDEPIAAPEPAPEPVPEAPLEPEPPLAPLPAPEPAPQPLPAAATPEPAAAPADKWDTLPAEPKPEEQWEVVPEEPAPTPAPAPERKATSGSAPPLATRPTDPAAPPQDAMAVAAKWAEEDEEAEHELEGSDKPAREYKSAKSKSGKSAKPAKPSRAEKKAEKKAGKKR